MFKIIAIVIVAAILAVLGYAATLPDTFRFERSTNIKASPEKIFPFLNDFQKSMMWSPYEKKDPAMKRAFSGAPSGKGSVYAFEGNKEIGTGRIEIIESVPSQKVALRLDMIKPFEGSNIIEYTLEPQGDATKVTWSMQGTSPYIAKVVCMFLNMEKMVGTDFEAGLASLKTIAEKS
jgi:hypothetical protein